MDMLFEKTSGFAHEKSGGSNQNEWLTPPALIAALGEFDLDPCAPEVRPWSMAKNHFSSNGLERAWNGRVWLNPPYGNYLARWMSKGAEHGNCIALTFARTDTKVFHDVIFPGAAAMLFMSGRIRFHRVDGTAGDCAAAPSVLIAFDVANAECLRTCGLRGKFIALEK
jgi:hypothetical protein